MTRFESVEAVKAKSTEVLNQRTSGTAFNNGKVVWRRCRDRQGENIEGEKVVTKLNKRHSSGAFNDIWDVDVDILIVRKQPRDFCPHNEIECYVSGIKDHQSWPTAIQW
ncbi:hypothetical protein NQ318_006566 [Aromia moschata]|uniref:Transposase n=1 Tax=Aromia moschata TaxID=1265417 RepID=A0AAV8YPT0_9CUCU|nr:hypothetical protein NQ318_006566 [Aromia moschata]